MEQFGGKNNSDSFLKKREENFHKAQKLAELTTDLLNSLGDGEDEINLNNIEFVKLRHIAAEVLEQPENRGLDLEKMTMEVLSKFVRYFGIAYFDKIFFPDSNKKENTTSCQEGDEIGWKLFIKCIKIEQLKLNHKEKFE